MTPAASDMVAMTWDQDLMEFAVDWTSNCLYVIKDNTTTDLWPEAGQVGSYSAYAREHYFAYYQKDLLCAFLSIINKMSRVPESSGLLNHFP